MVKNNHHKESNWNVIKQAIGIDCYSVRFSTLLAFVSKMDPESRLRNIALCEEIFSTYALRMNELARVGAAKLIVALLPNSLSTLRKWLEKNRPRSVYEIHFSIFCYLDEVQYFDNLKPFKDIILQLVTAYLMKSKGDQALAYWMAVDLVADHWNLRDSLMPLLAVAENAMFQTTRLAAIRALEKASAKCLDQEAVLIKETLERLSKRDSSRAIKAATSRLKKRI